MTGRSAALWVFLAVGCRQVFGLHEQGQPPSDVPIDVSAIATCSGDTLMLGSAVVQTCSAWGCETDGSGGRCRILQPSGSAVTSEQVLSGAGPGSCEFGSGALQPLRVTAQMTIDDTGVLNYKGMQVRGSGCGNINGYDFFQAEQADAVVYRFSELTIIPTGSLKVMGTHAVVLIATDSIDIQSQGEDVGSIDLTQTCATNNVGPGGFAGGIGSGIGQGKGGGGFGGGGGGFGSYGGSGNGGTAFGGQPYIDIGSPVALRGGGGGGAGIGGTSAGAGAGGGGGGAIQLITNGTFNLAGTINAGGCGGRRGSGSVGGGGGGGAGGLVLIEAPTIEASQPGFIAANGGGGGGGGSGSNTTDGATALPSGDTASGGATGGGSGATTYGNAIAGNGPRQGGGGGVGWIRIETRSGYYDQCICSGSDEDCIDLSPSYCGSGQYDVYPAFFPASYAN